MTAGAPQVSLPGTKKLALANVRSLAGLVSGPGAELRTCWVGGLNFAPIAGQSENSDARWSGCREWMESIRSACKLIGRLTAK